MGEVGESEGWEIRVMSYVVREEWCGIDVIDLL